MGFVETDNKKDYIIYWKKRIFEVLHQVIKQFKASTVWVNENIVNPILVKITELWQCSSKLLETSNLTKGEHIELQQEFNLEAEDLLKKFEKKIEDKQQQSQQLQQEQQLQQTQSIELDCKKLN